MKLDAELAVEGKHLPTIDEVGRAAESLGFAGLWTSETKHDSFLPLAVAANSTRALDLGTSIAIAFSRSPMTTAQISWDLQDLSGGRFILGLGTQVKAHIERRFSMPWGKPAARLKDYILALRAIWQSFQKENSLDYEGEFYRHTLMTPFFNQTVCEECGVEHTRLVRKDLSDRQPQDDEDIHPWRYTEAGEDNETLPY